ncbi:MAG: RsmB/NOP family class I SAM-dependent RNA methyltransferase [Candidatus Wallbacteria bacterium]|nr:RsmB/NOP family class I SAM-dependent RNA methyltransferase [Candidatus Wallbacteria bacterium]
MISNSRVAIEAVRRRNTLEFLVGKISGQKYANIQPEIREIMLSALAEHFFTTGSHPGAVVSSAVEKAKKKSRKSAGFVNAVLRKAVLRPDYRDSLPGPKESNYNSLLYSFPEWIIRATQSAFPDWEKVLDTLNQPPPNTLRLDPGSTGETARTLELEGYRLAPAHLPYAYYYNEPKNLLDSKAWSQGKFYFQDEGSQLIAEIASTFSADKVLDLCAAPGGKVTLLAQKCPEKVYTATDLPDRIPLIRENLQRMKLSNVNIIGLDQLKPGYDLILVDAPCSSLGVIRRHPEIKWEKQQKDLSNFQKTQEKLLDQAFNLLKPGGAIFYSVCTYTKEETGDLLNLFLNSQIDARIETLEYRLDRLNLKFPCFIKPGFLEMDGFFLALLKKC